MRRGGFGVGSDHGVKGEKRWEVALVENLVRVVEVVGVVDGYGGNELAQTVGLIKETVG